MDDEGEMMSAQAYQVIGFLSSLDPENIIPESEWVRALDYFSDTTKFDEEFLAWPSMQPEAKLVNITSPPATRSNGW